MFFFQEQRIRRWNCRSPTSSRTLWCLLCYLHLHRPLSPRETVYKMIEWCFYSPVSHKKNIVPYLPSPVYRKQKTPRPLYNTRYFTSLPIRLLNNYCAIPQRRYKNRDLRLKIHVNSRNFFLTALHGLGDQAFSPTSRKIISYMPNMIAAEGTTRS